jgi:hypothetical protein
MIEISTNDIVLKDMYEENPSVQIETSSNLKNDNEKTMKGNLKRLHA